LIDIKKSIHGLIQFLISTAKIGENNFKRENIRKYVNRRCQDYRENQKRMINSILDKPYRRIVLDRILIENNDHSTVLLTDKEDINSATIKHFQTAAGAVNELKVILSEWQSEYTPQSAIDSSIYNSLLLEIDMEEFLVIISHLPNGKASGPTGISNEMIKKCDNSLLLVIKHLFEICINLQDIPNEWKIASVYPIPKPKEWQCKLNNTRPITLLETLQKAFTKIINGRLT
jgi:hypothetical protein